MEKKYLREEPTRVEKIRNGYKLSYNIHESSEEEILEAWRESIDYENGKLEPEQWFIDEHRYCCYTVDIPMGQWNTDGIINAIIREKYRQDEMEAITNNMAAVTSVFMQTLVSDGIIAATKYLKDSINDENTLRFKEMQEWRAMAKAEAKSIIKV